MGERYNGIVEVVGSIPSGSTIKTLALPAGVLFWSIEPTFILFDGPDGIYISLRACGPGGSIPYPSTIKTLASTSGGFVLACFCCGGVRAMPFGDGGLWGSRQGRATGQSSMNRARILLFSLITMVFGLGIVVVGLEMALRFFPVDTSPFLRPVTEADPVLRAPPGEAFRFSSDWDFKNPHEGRYNNDGFINDQDYHLDDPRPLIAVIGDSFIEAKMVEHAETLQGRLQAHVGEKGRVYSFSMSGAPLSQYLAWAAYARDRYNADALIINVVGNDFDESLEGYKLRDGFHHYVAQPDGTLALRLSPYEPSLLRRVLLQSSLARYLAFHLHVRQRWQGVHDFLSALRLSSRRHATFQTANSRVDDSQRMLARFFLDLPRLAGLPPERILFVVDGRRGDFDTPGDSRPAAVGYFEIMRQSLMARARQQGYGVVDLDPAFAVDFGKNRKPFNSPFDGHWNRDGHRVAFEAVLNSGWLKP